MWQAPAEGGIPRYMAIFQTTDAPAIGPVRSSRLYFVAWATEWKAMYVHVGGAPNALAYLQANSGKTIYNADEFRWGGSAGYLWRITTRFAPHNVYTSTVKMDQLETRLKATAPQTTSPYTFKDDALPSQRPVSGSIVVPYLANRISYTYDPATNRYRRAVTGAKVQVDAGHQPAGRAGQRGRADDVRGPAGERPGRQHQPGEAPPGAGLRGPRQRPRLQRRPASSRRSGPRPA